MPLIARVWPEDGGFVAECVELRVVGEGDTEEAAVANLREAVAAFLARADPAEAGERLHAGSYVQAIRSSAAASGLDPYWRTIAASGLVDEK